MENQSSQRYAALPERLYVLWEGRILYKVTRGMGPRMGMGRKGFVAGRPAFMSLPGHVPAMRPAPSPLLSWSFSFLFCKREVPPPHRR